jgi:hypothetical protein
MSGWCGSCGPGGSALATAGLKTIAAAAAIPTTRRHITLKFIPCTPLECAARERHVGEAGVDGRLGPGSPARSLGVARGPRSRHRPGTAVTTVAGAAINTAAVAMLESFVQSISSFPFQNHQGVADLSTMRPAALHQPWTGDIGSTPGREPGPYSLSNAGQWVDRSPSFP